MCVLRVSVFPGVKFTYIEQKRDGKKSSCIKTKTQWVLFSFTVDIITHHSIAPELPIYESIVTVVMVYDLELGG